MVATLLPRPLLRQLDSSLSDWMIPAAAMLAGIGVAAGIATAPSETLDGVVARLDLAAILPAAAPPLGATARSMLALGLGTIVALIGCAAHLRRWLLPAGASLHRLLPDAPVVRRADAHPDAPPRRPIRASEDLGQPLPIIATNDDESGAEVPEPPLPWMSPPPERRLPRDLDLPMSVFDPGAVPAAPMEPARPLPSLTVPPPPPAPATRPTLIDPGERFESVALPPLPGGEATIASLLERLERGAARRQATVAAPVPAPVSLDETLQRLRRLATG
ncbi:hypothetical protein [Sphingomonas adhaesiva]|uniref:hypothetical protein n=1 Tax=Sphingomonas adhaesiva TaxID=28212 RepID=UPI002FF4C6EC